MPDTTTGRGGLNLDRRSVLTLGGAAALAGLLGACGGGAGPEPAAGAGGGAASGPGGGRPVLQQWYHQYGEAGTQQAVERYAAAYPSAEVQVSWKQGEYDQSTTAALTTDAGPDVFEYANGATIDMIREGHVADLTDLFGDAGADFQQSILAQMSYEGKIYAVPQFVDTQVLVYRPSMLDQAGVRPPRTMDELIDAARTLTKGEVKGLFLGNDGGAELMGGPMLWSAGLDYLTPDHKFGFDDPRAATALGKLRELWEAEVLLLHAPKDWSDPAALTDGLTAMQFTGLWTFPQLEEALGDDFGVLPWPALDDRGNPSVPVGAYGSCVSARSNDVEAAKAFVKWLWIDQTAHQLDFATSYGFHIPARQSLISRAKTLEQGQAAEAAQIVVEHGMAQTPTLWTPKDTSAFTAAMNRIIKDGADPRAQIAEVRAVVDAELKRVLALRS
jgi:multiple sugar transport system substrate-binding protein